jgi:hypothetical protein
MDCNKTHSHPEHTHGPDCGHVAVQHGDHVDYLHNGHLHFPHDDHCDEHTIEVTEKNPSVCNQTHSCGEHQHGPDCGHEALPHGDHIDYLVNGRLHHVHDGHCDDHGPITVLSANS